MWYGEAEGVLTLNADLAIPTGIEGYDRIVRGRQFYGNSQPGNDASRDVRFNVSREMDTLTVIVANGRTSIDSIQIELAPFAMTLFKDYGGAAIKNLDPEKLSVVASNNSLNVKLYFQRIQMRKEGEKLTIQNFGVDVVYRRVFE
jgi:hypothetical protein